MYLSEEEYQQWYDFFFQFSFSDNQYHTQPETPNRWQQVIYKTQLGKKIIPLGIKSYHKLPIFTPTFLQYNYCGFLEFIRLNLQCESTNSAETFFMQ